MLFLSDGGHWKSCHRTPKDDNNVGKQTRILGK